MCENCAFGQQITDRSFSGQTLKFGFCCSITVNGNTNCSSKERLDGKNIIYKKLNQ